MVTWEEQRTANKGNYCPLRAERGGGESGPHQHPGQVRTEFSWKGIATFSFDYLKGTWGFHPGLSMLATDRAISTNH
jgi:hypothetical protein